MPPTTGSGSGVVETPHGPLPYRLRRLAGAGGLRLMVRRGRLEVTAPAGGVSLNAILAGAERLIREQAAWCSARLSEQRAHVPSSLESAAWLPIRGRPRQLLETPTTRPATAVTLDEDTLHVARGRADRRPLDVIVRAALIDLARADIAAVVSTLDPQAVAGLASIRLADQRTRWGSAAPGGRLSFSWRLVMAEPPMLAFVVAHEVAHLRIRGHGPTFYAWLAQLCPDHRRRRAELRHIEPLLRAVVPRADSPVR